MLKNTFHCHRLGTTRQDSCNISSSFCFLSIIIDRNKKDTSIQMHFFITNIIMHHTQLFWNGQLFSYLTESITFTVSVLLNKLFIVFVFSKCNLYSCFQTHVNIPSAFSLQFTRGKAIKCDYQKFFCNALINWLIWRVFNWSEKIKILLYYV